MPLMLQQQIASAFSHRQRPTDVTNVLVCSSLRDDALHFAGKDWESVSAQDWRRCSDAFFGFSPDAFVYFLPSILSLSLERSNRPLIAADALVTALDTSADPSIWPEWFAQRFVLLTANELAVLKDWSVHYLAGADNGEGSEFSRVQDTLAMLELNLQP
jgi:hypothetical protein